MLFLVARFLDRTEGEVLYVSKPKLPSYGLALPLKFTANRPVVLDVDDREAGLCSKGSFVQTYLGSLSLRATRFNLLDSCDGGALGAVGCGNGLQHVPSGQVRRGIIPHIRDTEAFDTDRVDGRTD